MRYSRERLQKEIAAGETRRIRLFWRPGERRPPLHEGCLSQWWPVQCRIDGRAYPSAEHFMMASKAQLFDDGESGARILAASTPAEAKELGRAVQGFDEAVWEAHRERIALSGNLAKFGQHADLGAFLLSTGTDVLAEASPKDLIWGIGLNADHPRAPDPREWRGINLLGFTLMEVREILALRARLDIPKSRAAELGLETKTILDKGSYVSPSGRDVSLARDLASARRGTVEYGPRDPGPRIGVAPRGQCRIEVCCETTLSAARRLMSEGFQTAALNFASGTHPGGGFLHGARAQEEYLARSSGLYACLEQRGMYRQLSGRLDPFYDDFVIYSPAVPVFRDDDGNLLEDPWKCDLLTSPAVHARGVTKYCPEREPEIEPVMRRRTERVLRVAAAHGCRALVLGAWGCGAFGNDSGMIARSFRDALEREVPGSFEAVVFAVTDWSPERSFIGAFERTFPR